MSKEQLLQALQQMHLENSRLTDGELIAELLKSGYIYQAKHGYRLTDYGALVLGQYIVEAK